MFYVLIISGFIHCARITPDAMGEADAVDAADVVDGVDDAPAFYDSDDKDARDNSARVTQDDHDNTRGHSGHGDDAWAALVVRVDDELRAAAVRADAEAGAAGAAQWPWLKTKAIPTVGITPCYSIGCVDFWLFSYPYGCNSYAIPIFYSPYNAYQLYRLFLYEQ